jgi:hypothetical protein
MSNYAANIPLINVPFVTPDGRVSEAWFMFLIQLFRRTGGTSGNALEDLAINVATLADDPAISNLFDALENTNVQFQTDAQDAADKASRSDLVAQSVTLSLVLQEAQDVLAKLRRALLDAVIDQLTLLDPVRSMAYQDASNVNIKGGSIDGTPIGTTTASTANFTTVAASGQITSTVATGTAPFVVASTTLVPNLHVATADSLGTAGAYPADATDLPTVIALANYIKSRNISKGV